jgi:Mg2+ and Co2+ transporter CorA
MNMIVPDNWNIPEQIRERFGDSAGKQRAMIADGHLLLVLHEPPAPNNRDRKARLLWRTPTGSWSWNIDGNINNLLKKHIADFAERFDQLDKQIQNASGAEDYFRILQCVMPLHRSCRNLHLTLQQARELVPTDRDIIVARDAAADIERSFELLLMDAKNGLDYTMARKTELQSQSTYAMSLSAHRLNLLAALFFPITAISSVFGMNTLHGTEPFTNAWLFWSVLGFGFLSGLFLTKIIGGKGMNADSAVQTEPDGQQSDRGRNQTRLRGRNHSQTIRNGI